MKYTWIVQKCSEIKSKNKILNIFRNNHWYLIC